MCVKYFCTYHLSLAARITTHDNNDLVAQLDVGIYRPLYQLAAVDFHVDTMKCTRVVHSREKYVILEKFFVLLLRFDKYLTNTLRPAIWFKGSTMKVCLISYAAVCCR